jgi:hypothetical protein
MVPVRKWFGWLISLEMKKIAVCVLLLCIQALSLKDKARLISPSALQMPNLLHKRDNFYRVVNKRFNAIIVSLRKSLGYDKWEKVLGIS